MVSLREFVRESNRIEGIHREPTNDEIEMHRYMETASSIEVSDVELFVSKIQPGAKLREHAGMNVRVGKHIPIAGGPVVKGMLENILMDMAESSPYAIHQRYEHLHPFMDGNGRSGRALWLRMMGGSDRVPLGFLHTWYYQSLDGWRAK